ncbi:hypothetical protein [Quadrisphaera sp. DSM 44207]|uniref:hypothetical protein n=1 Tax=Quadrisphaera sp. DSM 44207 TaxID=1881057 RepID=UPI00088A2FF9|nr:hypothetical protein [Quadrisphaera sp. DSM 44207]SDQ63504.1 hypothetical protein SAMN05428996_2176 [Quadrisphaera sp. DSM 44207]
MLTHALRARAPMLAAGLLVLSPLALAGCAQNEPDPGDPLQVEEPAAEGAEEPTAAAEADETVSGEVLAPEDIDEGSVERVAGEPTVAAAELVADPAGYVDQTVVVQAPVAGVVGEQAFTITDDASGAAAGPDRTVLVIGPTTELADGDVITVGGTVRGDLDQAALEAELGVDWPDGALDAYTGGPWVDAAAIELATG